MKVNYNMAKEQELKEENKLLKDLLKETLYAMCSYRAEKGYCADCKNAIYCTAKKVIPKVEKILNTKH